MNSELNYDFAIVGGGVIGLSIAWRLAEHGTVILIERQKIGREASWAGAGILPPWSLAKAKHPTEILQGESFRLHESWAKELSAETGIDTGFRKCGALVVARTPGDDAALAGQALEWRENGVRVQDVSLDDLDEFGTGLYPSRNTESSLTVRRAVFLPDEVQIRNPDHLRALKAACIKKGVLLKEGQGESRFDFLNDDRVQIATDSGTQVFVRQICLAAGAWTEQVCAAFDVKISTTPVRGQMLLFKLPTPIFNPIVYEGTRYLVPRDDGHVVVGSTLEEVGFDKSTTPEGIDGLMNFANSICPQLNQQTLVDSWAGLRPASYDGFPYIGPVRRSAGPNHGNGVQTGTPNAWVATAHFRSGLLLSTGTAKLVTQLMTGQTPFVDPSPFRIDRG